jgi:hypothetical protein
MRRTLGIAIAVILLLGALGGPAEAHTRTFATTVTLSHMPLGAGTAFGNVFSNRSECDVGRTVDLYLTSSADPVGSTTSTAVGDDGQWSINGNFGGSSYYATVTRVTFKRNARHRHRCGGDFSDVVSNVP